MAQLKGKYIEDAAVTLAKQANIATASIMGRKTASTGVQEVLSKADALTLLNVEDGANAYVHPNHSGDVTSVADGAQTIAAAAVTLAKMANLATDTFIGRTTAATGVPEALTKTQALGVLNVEDGADVTDEANVTDALDGATLSAATVATNDKVLIQDTDGSDVLKTVTVAEIIALAGGSETRIVEILTLDATDISNKYSDDMTQVPVSATSVQVVPVGGIPQEYTVDFTIITDGSDIKRLNWDGLGLESLLESTDKLVVTYTYTALV